MKLSTKKPNPYKALNKGIKALMKDLTNNFPYNFGLTLISGAFTVLKKMNKKFPHKYFQSLINIPYGDNVKAHDDTFFMEGNPEFPSFLVSHVESLKKFWRDLEPAKRQAIWEHMDNLMKLNQEVIDYRKAKKLPSIENINDEEIVATEGNDSDPETAPPA